MRRTRLPVVWLNSGKFLKMNCVAPDDFGGAQDLGCRLIDMGYRRAVYVGASRGGHRSIEARHEGLAAGFGTGEFLTINFTQEAVAEVVEHVCAGQWPATVLVTPGDNAAFTLLAVALSRGLTVPDDLGLVSCHTDIHLSRQDWEPRIAGMTHDVHEMGAVAARMLLERIGSGGKPTPSVRIPERFVEGNTIRCL